MATSHIAHDCVVGNHVIMINYAGLTGHVVVEDYATVGGLSGVRPFARVGAFGYVGGCSKVNQDVPPFVIAVGTPATARAVNVVGMRRAGIDGAARRTVQSAFRILYRSGLAPATALARAKSELGEHPLVARLLEFIAASKLGVISPSRRRAPADSEESGL
jgi:UDP-N-acetylglucosamine acyltransferase